jgi:hypothetical protein
MTTQKSDILIGELILEFGKGDIYEARLIADGEVCYGIMRPSSQRVYVDPAPSVLDTLFHELLHRRFPRWGEKRVTQTASALVQSLSEKERREWYRRYQRIVRKSPRPVKVR